LQQMGKIKKVNRMIPSGETIAKLWDVHGLPEEKKHHCRLVAGLAMYMVEQIQEKQAIAIQKNLVYASALLHDIDKKMENLPGEQHPDAAVRMLTELGMQEIARMVQSHPLHAILDERIAPKTIEEKILFLSDKMVKHDVISVEERFRLWEKESLDEHERSVLVRAYPKVKQLERILLGMMQLRSDEVILGCKTSILTEGGSVL